VSLILDLGTTVAAKVPVIIYNDEENATPKLRLPSKTERCIALRCVQVMKVPVDDSATAAFREQHGVL
jgi:hypothetical protein